MSGMNQETMRTMTMISRGRGLTTSARVTWALIACIALLAAALSAAPARAAFGIAPGSFDVTTSTSQAGGHPDLKTEFTLNATTDGMHPDGGIKDAIIDLPVGLGGAPAQLPHCSEVDFGYGRCKPATQVGVAYFEIDFGYYGVQFPATVGIYNLTPAIPSAGLFGMSISGIPIKMYVSVRPGDYGVRTAIVNSSQFGGPLWTARVTLWGVPGDPSHDAERFVNQAALVGGVSVGGLRTPMMTNPTACGGPLSASISVNAWENPDLPDTATATLPPITGCDLLNFDGAVDVHPTSPKAGSPSGYDVDVTIPQTDDPDAPATANLRTAVVKLPQGVALSPAAADGLAGCTDAQMGFGSDDAPACPGASKIGAASLETPALLHEMHGSIYVGTQQPDDPYRIFLALAGDGVTIKLRGSVHADPVTGQLTTTFANSPQQPFSALKLSFFGGSRAALVNPPQCGTYTTTAALTPWSGGDQAVQSSRSFVIDEGCAARGFAPGFTAGTTNPVAGASSPFTLTFSRGDADQELKDIAVDLPAGLLGRLASVPLCGEAQAAAGTCGEESRVGSATTGTGAGTDPLYLGGRVYMTGPYKGAPLGLSVIVPAVAGPFDLGTVVVRTAVFIDEHTAALRVVSDPLPTILEGIPLQIRKVNVTIDRAGFMFNPTSCDPMQVGGTITSAQGTKAAVSSRFQVGDCASLPFSPSFTAVAGGRTFRKLGASLKVHIGSKAGQANLKQVAVTLPRRLPARLVPTLNNACEYQVQEAKGYQACPEDSKVGWAVAKTPVLPGTVEGPAYIITRPDGLPKLAIFLRSTVYPLIKLQLDGRIDINKSTGNLTKTTFEAIPDVPITSFDLNLPIGPHSALAAPGKDLCNGKKMGMKTTLVAQSGKRIVKTRPIKVTGCKAKASKRAARSRAHATHAEHRR